MLALALRVAYTLAIAPGGILGMGGDGFLYHDTANLLADGAGYVLPPSASVFGGQDADPELEPTARHPPLWPFVLAGASELGATGKTSHRLVGALLGALMVGLLGLTAREVGGELAGLFTACLAAVYPAFVAADAALMSEPLYGLLLSAALLLACRLWRRPSTAEAAGLGALVGLAALARGEALLLVPLLLLPTLWRGAPGRGKRVAIGCLALVVVLAPWSIRNSLKFDRPVLVSTGYGGVLAGANCPEAYGGVDLGSWNVGCALRAQREGNEAAVARLETEDSLTYAREHSGRVPAVLAVRLLRTWDLYQPFRVRPFEWARIPGWVIRAEAIALYLLLPLAAWGLVILRRRGAPLVPLLAPVALVMMVTLAFYGLPRFRYAAELSLIVLAGCALATAAGRRRALPWAGP